MNDWIFTKFFTRIKTIYNTIIFMNQFFLLVSHMMKLFINFIIKSFSHWHKESLNWYGNLTRFWMILHQMLVHNVKPPQDKETMFYLFMDFAYIWFCSFYFLYGYMFVFAIYQHKIMRLTAGSKWKLLCPSKQDLLLKYKTFKDDDSF